jgi:TonB-linked SusC/RagA family outer membrane protein
MRIITKYIKRPAVAIIAMLLCTGAYAQQDSTVSVLAPTLSNSHKMHDKIQTGLETLSRETITGAVSTVSGTTLEKSPTNILSETLYGRLPGLQINTSLSELVFFGYSNFTKTIRGTSAPIIIIDGVVSPTQYYEFLTPKEIDNVTILKDAAVMSIYGVQSAGGAIVITTKRGFTGKRKVEAFADFSLQQMTKRPMFINSARYAELRNEAGERDGLGAYSQFSQTQIDKFRSGESPDYYPNNNWFDMFIKDVVMRERVGVNVVGGSENFHYFSTISFVNQDQPFIITDEPGRKYDPTPRIDIVNFRSNMDIKFNDYVSGYMRLTGNVKREKQSGNYYNGDGTIIPYFTIFYQPPTMFGPVSPIIKDNEDMSDQVTTVNGLDNPVYGMLNRSGYQTITETNVIAQAGLNFDLKFITEGLTAGGSMAYQTYSRNQVGTTQTYQRVIRGSDYSRLDNFSKYLSYNNTPLVYGAGYTFFYFLNLSAELKYNRKFGAHSIDALAYTYYQMRESEYISPSYFDATAEALPYQRQNFGISAQYGYNNRYFLRADLGYSGSDVFHPDHRYMLTPAISGAWVASNESFLADSFVSLLKLRASYGITANDYFGSTRLLYYDNVRTDGSELERGNPLLEAEKYKKINVGIDLGVAKMFTLNVDYFKTKIDNMLVSSASQIPEYQGVPLTYYPSSNSGIKESYGYEISLGFNKELSKDLSVFAEVNFMQAKNKIIDSNETLQGADYAYRNRTDGYRSGQLWGYLIDDSKGNGFFNSAEEIAKSGLTYSFGTPRVGDLKFIDLNGDGTIDEKDKAPMGYSSGFPEQEFSLTGGVVWKNWEFSFMFQGVNRRSFFLGDTGDGLQGIGVNESLSQGVYNDIHLNAWTPERYASGANITYPALSLSPSVNLQKSSFFLQNGAYLRLRNVELAYTLPETLAKKIASTRIRVALNIQNLFTLDKMQTKYVDPEIGRMDAIQPFRVYNLNLSVNF